MSSSTPVNRCVHPPCPFPSSALSYSFSFLPSCSPFPQVCAARLPRTHQVRVLTESTAITFKDPESAALLSNPATNAEITACCEDFKLLGRNGSFPALIRLSLASPTQSPALFATRLRPLFHAEFKALLKWRLSILRDKQFEAKKAAKEAGEPSSRDVLWNFHLDSKANARSSSYSSVS